VTGTSLPDGDPEYGPTDDHRAHQSTVPGPPLNGTDDVVGDSAGSSYDQAAYERLTSVEWSGASFCDRPPVNATLSAATIIVSLLAAGWALVAALRGRAPDLSHMIALAVVQLAVVALTVVAIVAVAGGERPDEPGTFWGYALTILCLPPLAAILARLEPTRWGSAIVTVVCLVVPVLVVRMQQTWAVPGV